MALSSSGMRGAGEEGSHLGWTSNVGERRSESKVLALSSGGRGVTTCACLLGLLGKGAPTRVQKLLFTVCQSGGWKSKVTGSAGWAPKAVGNGLSHAALLAAGGGRGLCRSLAFAVSPQTLSSPSHEMSIPLCFCVPVSLSH